MKLEIPDELFNEEELTNTPGRYRRFVEEWDSKGCDINFTTFENPSYDQLIVLKDIDFASLCSHHVLPFIGVAHVGYLPDKRICGISKLARVVDMFACRPQIQERMTAQIADYLYENLDALWVMVVVEGVHECMRIRGVRKPRASMITSAIRGPNKDDQKIREEFMGLIGKR